MKLIVWLMHNQLRVLKRRSNAALCLVVDLLLTDYSDILYYDTCFMLSFAIIILKNLQPT